MKKKQTSLHFLIEEGLEVWGDIQDELTLGEDCFEWNVEDEWCNVCTGEDIYCQDGCCPVCNYKEWTRYLDDHRHCDQASWDCPDEDYCPMKNN